MITVERRVIFETAAMELRTHILLNNGYRGENLPSALSPGNTGYINKRMNKCMNA